MTQKALVFVCEFCGKEYNSKTALQKHLKEKHPHDEAEEDEEIHLE